MRNRSRAREAAFQILYKFDLARQESGANPPTERALDAEIAAHFQHFDIPAPVREFAASLISGTLQEQSGLDALIEKYARNWKLTRLPVVDRNLLRMSLYELMRMPETPVSVILDEAIELGKQFGTADTAAFLNGILDSAAKELRTS